MENLKIRVTTEQESKEVQELFFELGFGWHGNGKIVSYLDKILSDDFGWLVLWKPSYLTNTVIQMGSGFEDCKEITLQYLRDLVVLKRNSIDDAVFKDSFGDVWYVDSTNSYWMFENDIWREADKPLFKLEPIKKLVDKEVKMKEFLNPEQGYALVKCFVGETPIPADWIEIPEGAEIAIESLGRPYFVKLNGETYDEFFCLEWRSGGLTEHSLRKYKKILWQRNPKTPNTSTQDKLKFIEKWLNGEKIQYILGVESEKTQWHNFTEGAMQYIKRHDIKFREAPKYVTINGIEFKNIESILNYIKSNFDLEDGV